MKCKICNKEISPDEAFTCEFCNSSYCVDCASNMGLCDCYGDLKRFS